MPVYSMTGYASVTHAGGLTVECRSVNGRFLDLSLKLPEELRAHEPVLRDLVSAQIKRGKLELRASLSQSPAQRLGAPTDEQLKVLALLQTQVLSALPDAQALTVADVLNLSRTLASTEAAQVQVPQAAQQCLQALKEARAREGERLVAILMERVELIAELARRAAPLVPAVAQRQQQRFLERWTEALKLTGASQVVTEQALQERALNEAAAYAIRIDVAEELSRLQAHLAEITRLLHSGGEIGKRLDFLIQELHREANTLCSKSAALELTNISVDMKVAIEQMREQVQNIE